MEVEDLCRSVHTVLLRLPLCDRPLQVTFRDGLYFFYETGETSPHAPTGRVVRVGNHPRSDGALVCRLQQHYSGRKNASVFRRYVGGALIRSATPQSPCLLPGPGLGHWEKQDAHPCEICSGIERQVSAIFRTAFRFRCVEISNRQERNRFEPLLIATLAACTVCQASSGWLGRYAYPTKVQNAGMWNSDFVGGPLLSETDLADFETLVAQTANKWAC
jgi:hypothetical protein